MSRFIVLGEDENCFFCPECCRPDLGLTSLYSVGVWGLYRGRKAASLGRCRFYLFAREIASDAFRFLCCALYMYHVCT